MKSEDEWKQMWGEIFKWIKGIRVSSWFFLFAIINGAMAFIQLLAVAFGFEFLIVPPVAIVFAAIAFFMAIIGSMF